MKILFSEKVTIFAKPVSEYKYFTAFNFCK